MKGRQPGELTPYRSNRDFYGGELRRVRTRAGLSFEALAARIPFSKSLLHRVEHAEVLPSPELSTALDRHFETDGLFARLYQLIVESQEIHPEQYRRSMEMEAKALVIEVYTGQVVPGLLQTKPYADALFRATNPHASDDWIQDKVSVRLDRQERLRSSTPPELSVIIDEAAIRRDFGGPEAMREQLALLADLADTPHVTVQIVPFRHGAHGLVGGTLKLMTLDDTRVAWEESTTTGTLLEAPERVQILKQKYDRLRSRALSPTETAAFIRAVMEELPE